MPAGEDDRAFSNAIIWRFLESKVVGGGGGFKMKFRELLMSGLKTKQQLSRKLNRVSTA